MSPPLMETPNVEKPQGIEFLIHKIFTKDLSFESPNSPLVFTKAWKPEAHIDIHTDSNKIDDKTVEVVLTLTATVTSEKEPAFVAETKQSGIFTITGAAAGQYDHIIGSFCPSVLFPYAREVLSNVIIRGGFPELNIAPVNFDALYEQNRQQQAEQSEPAKQ